MSSTKLLSMLDIKELSQGDVVCSSVELLPAENAKLRKKCRLLASSFALSLHLPHDSKGPHNGYLHAIDLLHLKIPAQSDGFYNESLLPQNLLTFFSNWIFHYFNSLHDGDNSSVVVGKKQLLEALLVSKKSGSGLDFWCMPVENADQGELSNCLKEFRKGFPLAPNNKYIGFVQNYKKGKQMIYTVHLSSEWVVNIPESNVLTEDFRPQLGDKVVVTTKEELGKEKKVVEYFLLSPAKYKKISRTAKKEEAKKPSEIENTVLAQLMKNKLFSDEDSLSGDDSLDLNTSDEDEEESAAEDASGDDDAKPATLISRKRLRESSPPASTPGMISHNKLPQNDAEFNIWISEGRTTTVFAWQAYIAHYAALGQVEKARQVIKRALEAIGADQTEARQDLLNVILNFERVYGSSSGGKFHYHQAYELIKQTSGDARVFKVAFQHALMDAKLSPEEATKAGHQYDKTGLLHVEEIAKDAVKFHRDAVDAWLLLLKARMLRFEFTHDKHPLDATYLQASQLLPLKHQKRALKKKYLKYIEKIGKKPTDLMQ